MGITDFFRGFFDRNNRITSLRACGYGANGAEHYQTLITEAAINLICGTVARAEFKTFFKGKEEKRTNYYIFNVEANKNRSAFLFWKEVVAKLLTEGSALVLMQNKQLYLADSYTMVPLAFKENIYEGIIIDEYPLSDKWNESNVLHLKYDNSLSRIAISDICGEYSKLITASEKGYKNSKARKGKYKIPAQLPKNMENEEDLKKFIQESLKDFMDPEKDAVLPEQSGFEYTEIAESKGSKSNDSGRETKNFINDVFDFIAVAFGIPPSLLKGDTVDTKDAVNNFLAFCVNPIAKLIQDEINRKMYGEKLYTENTYVTVDTTNIKSVDLKDIANSIDLLNRNGALTIDDTLRTLGKEPIGGEVGAMRFITKNLELLDKVLRNGEVTEGGD